jgi:AraC family transcriptional regulator
MSAQSVETLSSGLVLKRRSVFGIHLSERHYSESTLLAKHHHEVAICCIAITGGCNEAYRNHTREIKPLTVYFLPAGESHSLEFRSVGVRAFGIEVPDSCLARMRDYSVELSQWVHSRAGVASSLMMRLYREFHRSDSASLLAIEGLTLELLAEMSRERPRAQEHCLPRWLGSTKDLLQAHFAEHLKLESIAKDVGVHPVHLAREFRKHFGCTVGDYVRHLRLIYAAAQLSKADKPLAMIASDAGFTDQSHFTRVFKRITHMTPSEYRRIHSSR